MNYISAQSQLQCNFSEVEINSHEVELYATSYSNDLFKECIGEKNSGYFFYRDGSHIYALPEKEGLTRPIGFETVRINGQNKPYIFARLIDIAFRNLFESKGRRVYKKKYSSISFFHITSEDSLKIGELSLVPHCNYSVHPIIKMDKVIYLITISKEYKPKFSQSIEALNKKGVDTRDWDLKFDKIIATRSNIKKYLDRTNLQSKYDNALENLGSKKNEMQFIESTFSYFNKNIDSINTKLVSIKAISFLALPNVNFERISIKKPTHYYYNKNTTRGYINVALTPCAT